MVQKESFMVVRSVLVTRLSLAGLVVAAFAGTAIAQPNIDPDHKYAWNENVGWSNWLDANGAEDGVRKELKVLSGFIWFENVGWVNVGDGSPTDGVRYANIDNTDFGVNILDSGELTGFAWGENIGWINFDTRTALGPTNQQASFDDDSDRFRGYAWGENIGWLNLDNSEKFVGVTPDATCAADFNDDGFVDFFDVNDFTDCFDGVACPDGKTSDFNGDGFTDFFDYEDFILAFETGC
jgi:hypothetical protein